MNHEREEGTAYWEYGESLLKEDTRPNASRQIDEFEYTDILRPPYEPKDIIKFVELNDSIKQLVEVMATNVSLLGYGIKYCDDFDYSGADKNLQTEADKEWETLRLLYKNINPLENLSQLLYKILIDKYTIGWGCLEVLRNGIGEAVSLEYARACNIRIVQNKQSKTEMNSFEESVGGKFTRTAAAVRFKKFVQQINGKKVFFKEFGDLRQMDCQTGEYADTVADDRQATELAYFCVHSLYTDYGVPFWINISSGAAGSIKADALNYKYFTDGKILPAAITVSGGQLTKESLKTLRDGKGLDNAYKVLVLEATPFQTKNLDGTMEEGTVKIDVKPLTDVTNKDSLFREYQRQAKDNVRDSFRLPPIFTGASTDYNRATADTARKIAEEQVFIPERNKICAVFNKIISNEREIKYCELYLKGAVFSDSDEKNAALKVLDEAGALTPNMLTDYAGKILGKDFEAWDEELGNIPFKLLLQQKQGGAAEGKPEQADSLAVTKGEIRKMLEEVVE